MSDDTETNGVRVYDRPGSADRPPIWVVVVIVLLLIAGGIVGYFMLR